MLSTHEPFLLLPAPLDRPNFRSEHRPELVFGVPRWQHVPPLEPDPAYASDDRSWSGAGHLEEGSVRGPADEVAHRKGTFSRVQAYFRSLDASRRPRYDVGVKSNY